MKKILLPSVLLLFNFTVFAQWNPVTTNGFNNSANKSISCLKTYGNYLYAGTTQQGSTVTGEIWRSQTGNFNDWIKVFNTSAVHSFKNFAVINNALFAVGKSSNAGGQKIFKSTDGLSYKSFWDINASVYTILSFKGTGNADSVFIFKYNGSGDQIYKADPNTNDSTAQNSNSFRLTKSFPGEIITTAKVVTILGSDILFVATIGNTSYYPFLYKSTDGITFTKIGTHLNDFGSTVFIGGSHQYTGISSIEQNADTIYFGTKGNQAVNTDYFKSIDVGSTWNMVSAFPGWDEIPCMYNRNDELWFALADHWYGSNKIYLNRGVSGNVNSYPAGPPNNMGNSSNYGINGCMEYFKNYMYYGFENNTIGGQLHRLDICNFSLAPTANPNNNVCKGSMINFNANVSGGTPLINFFWKIGNDTIGSYTNSLYSCIIDTASVVAGIKVDCYAVDHYGCIATGNILLGMVQSTDIKIQVNSPNGPVTSGNLVIYKNIASAAGQFDLDTLAEEFSNVNGYYTFPQINAGNYWAKIYPDTAATSQFKDILPTYFGDQLQWDTLMKYSIGTLQHGCTVIDSDTINAFKVLGFGSAGTGVLRGRIVEDIGFKGPTDPIPGVDVKVGRKPPGGNAMVANGTTDANGWFEFQNVPFNNPGEEYVIYADIPGYGLDTTRHVQLTSGNPQALQLNFYVDSTLIKPDPTIYIGINTYESININNLSVFPNPANGDVSINYELSDNSNVQLSLYNILGIKINELINTKQPAGNYVLKTDFSKFLPPGNYMIILSTNNGNSIKKIVITK